MPDMLVKLYQLPDISSLRNILSQQEITVRRAMAYEKGLIRDWVRTQYGEAWAFECELAFSQHPVSCFIAVHQQKIVGFSCYECTAKNFFGPMGVEENMRGKGIGKLLLVDALEAMRTMSYAYAIIGGVRSAEYYQRAVNAMLISDSHPGIYPAKLLT